MTGSARGGVLLGAHVSTAGGIAMAPGRAKAIGATAMQVFAKQPSRWSEPAPAPEELAAYRKALDASGVKVVAVHDSYLINLASPDDALRLRSLISFVAELKRAGAMRADLVVSHPGNYIDDRDSGIARNIDAIVTALETVPGDTMLLLETTAGSGTALGARFEELALILDALPRHLQPRVGVCVDTAHIHAAGYDIAREFDSVFDQLDDVIGRHRLRMMHLNDSKAALGSRRDRHELIGEGAIGEGAFRRIMADERFAGVPKVIETPKLGEAASTDRRMIARLRGYLARHGERR